MSVAKQAIRVRRKAQFDPRYIKQGRRVESYAKRRARALAGEKARAGRKKK